MKRLRVVAALLVRPGPQFMATQRPAGAARGGLWEFPGGKVEPGETDAQALVREIREELGCEIAVERFLAVSTHRYPELEVELALYQCRLVSGEPTPAPHSAQALTWASSEELARLDFAEADLPFLPLLRDLRA